MRRIPWPLGGDQEFRFLIDAVDAASTMVRQVDFSAEQGGPNRAFIGRNGEFDYVIRARETLEGLTKL